MKLLKFSAGWCNPCKAQMKEFNENPVNVELQEIDIDSDDDTLSEQYHIMSIPTMILLDDNNETIQKWTGFTKSNVINDYLSNMNNELEV